MSYEESPFLIHSVPGIHSAVYTLEATLNGNASICSPHRWLSVFMVMSVCFLTHILPVSSPIQSVFFILIIYLPVSFPPSSPLIWSYPVLSHPPLSAIPISPWRLAPIHISSPPCGSHCQLHRSHTIFICHPRLYQRNYNQVPRTRSSGPRFPEGHSS